MVLLRISRLPLNLLDANFEIPLDVRACTQWLNTMQQLVQWEDVQFMSGKILAHVLVQVLTITELVGSLYPICSCDAVTSLGTMTLPF